MHQKIFLILPFFVFSLTSEAQDIPLSPLERERLDELIRSLSHPEWSIREGVMQQFRLEFVSPYREEIRRVLESPERDPETDYRRRLLLGNLFAAYLKEKEKAEFRLSHVRNFSAEWTGPLPQYEVSLSFDLPRDLFTCRIERDLGLSRRIAFIGTGDLVFSKTGEIAYAKLQHVKITLFVPSTKTAPLRKEDLLLIQNEYSKLKALDFTPKRILTSLLNHRRIAPLPKGSAKSNKLWSSPVKNLPLYFTELGFETMIESADQVFFFKLVEN